MARIQQSRFAGRKGATLACEKCKRDIPKGEVYRYYTVGYRSRYRHIRCYRSECTPRQSEMTNSKMAGVYSGSESLMDTVNALAFTAGDDAASIISEVESALETAADEWRNVGEEYREAAEASPTGLIFGQDYNEVADSIENAADELANWSADEDEPDYDSCTNVAHEGGLSDEPEHLDRGVPECDGCVDIASEWLGDIQGSVESHAQDAESNIEVY